MHVFNKQYRICLFRDVLKFGTVEVVSRSGSKVITRVATAGAANTGAFLMRRGNEGREEDEEAAFLALGLLLRLQRTTEEEEEVILLLVAETRRNEL